MAGLETRVAELQKNMEETAARHAQAVSQVQVLEADKASLAAQLATAQQQALDIAALKKTLDERSSALALAESRLQNLAGADERIAALETKVAEQTAAVQQQQAARAEGGTAGGRGHGKDGRDQQGPDRGRGAGQGSGRGTTPRSAR